MYSEEKVLLGDGSTVINVYYNRTIFNMSFSEKTYNSISPTCKTELYTSGGKVTFDENGLYIISIKLGQNVEDIFPTNAKLIDVAKAVKITAMFMATGETKTIRIT